MTNETLQQLVRKSFKPTGNQLLDRLFEEYTQQSLPDDKAHYYRFLFHLGKLHASQGGGSMVELGSKYGAASLHYLLGGASKNSSVLIDAKDNFRRNLFLGLKAKFHVGLSVYPEALAAAPAQVDVVLVDSDHSYYTTAGEFELWEPRVKPQGLMLFDDMGAYDYFKREDFACGRFWHELKASQPTRCIDLMELHPTGWGFTCYLKE